MMMIDKGDNFPDFELANQEGETVTAGDLRGHRLVLFVFPRASTPGCTKQACGFRDHMPDFDGATVLGISPDKPEALKKWKEKEQLTYDLLSDPEHELLEKIGAWGEKSMYGKKYMGVIRSHFVVDEDGTVLDAQIKISPAKSVERATAFFSS